MRIFKLFLFAFAFVALPAFGQTIINETEPNNSYSTTQVCAVSPVVGLGTIDPANDIDYWRMTVFGYRTIHAKLFPAPLTSQFLYIYNQAGRIVAQSTLAGGAVQEIYYTNTSGFGFYFYAVVRSPWGMSSPDSYNLELSW